jgi:hypothetical protein
MDTDIDLLVQSVERDLAPNTFADITPATYVMVMPEPDPVIPTILIGNVILRFQDVELDVDQRERIFRRARLSANEAIILDRAMAALQSNLADITQDNNVIGQANTLAATTGTTFTTAQLSNHVRSLAQGVAILAQNDINAKRELNGVIRLLTRRLESTD